MRGGAGLGGRGGGSKVSYDIAACALCVLFGWERGAGSQEALWGWGWLCVAGFCLVCVF